MDILANVRMGLIELRLNKLRSFLTMLGIIFGVAAVIAIVAIGEGARIEAMKQIESLGADIIRIKSVAKEGSGRAEQIEKGSKGLRVGDCAAIRANCPSALFASPIIEVKHKIRRRGVTPSGVNVAGVTEDFQSIHRLRIREGRFLCSYDNEKAKKVCVLGSDAERALFPTESPLGEYIRIGNDLYQVIGVIDNRAKSGGAGDALVHVRNINSDVYIPLRTAFKRAITAVNKQVLQEIVVKIRDPSEVIASGRLIGAILKRVHYGAKDFEMEIPLALLRQRQRTQNIFNMVMGCIAGISLFVGGIGIMNIMLATVSQRTREIGIRRALGATRRDVLIQFLIECLVLAIIGGLIGILDGIVLGFAISKYAGWQTVISYKAILLAVIVSSVTGLVFGLFPARKAAGLDPMEALRHE